MQDLTLVGLTEDKKKLVLVSDAGEEFTVAADAKLRAALRGDHARLGQLEIDMESTLRPRDIQARIRAGETPENVAAAAQTTVERIMTFAGPVLAERAHVAERAQRASVRRKGGEGPTRLLGDAVSERLRGRNVDPASVEWDSWRREDGRWTLVADYRSGDSARHAEFVYDAPGRYVVPEDEEARWLVGEQSTHRGPQPRAAGAPGRRLTAVGSGEDELPLGADAIDLVREAPTDDPTSAEPAEVSAEEHTTDLSEAASSVREARPADDAAPGEEATAEHGDGDAEAGEDDAAPRQKRPVKKTRGRASVPSWDEIMFGGGRSE